MNETQSDQTPTSDGHPHDFPKLEEETRELGRLIGDACPPGHGFALLVFDFDGPALTYVSNAQREDMCSVLRELIARLEGRAAPTWKGRG